MCNMSIVLIPVLCSYSAPLPPLGHIWRKGNINRTVCVLQYCVPL